MTDDKISQRTAHLNRNGRPLGAKNKFTTLKDAFLEAFKKTGGADALVAWANKNDHNRALFYQMVTRLFPQEVAHSGSVQATLKFDFGENGNGNGHDA